MPANVGGFLRGKSIAQGSMELELPQSQILFEASSIVKEEEEQLIARKNRFVIDSSDDESTNNDKLIETDSSQVTKSIEISEHNIGIERSEHFSSTEDSVIEDQESYGPSHQRTIDNESSNIPLGELFKPLNPKEYIDTLKKADSLIQENARELDLSVPKKLNFQDFLKKIRKPEKERQKEPENRIDIIRNDKPMLIKSGTDEIVIEAAPELRQRKPFYMKKKKLSIDILNEQLKEASSYRQSVETLLESEEEEEPEEIVVQDFKAENSNLLDMLSGVFNDEEDLEENNEENIEEDIDDENSQPSDEESSEVDNEENSDDSDSDSSIPDTDSDSNALEESVIDYKQTEAYKMFLEEKGKEQKESNLFEMEAEEEEMLGYFQKQSKEEFDEEAILKELIESKFIDESAIKDKEDKLKKLHQKKIMKEDKDETKKLLDHLERRKEQRREETDYYSLMKKYSKVREALDLNSIGFNMDEEQETINVTEYSQAVASDRLDMNIPDGENPKTDFEYSQISIKSGPVKRKHFSSSFMNRGSTSLRMLESIEIENGQKVSTFKRYEHSEVKQPEVEKPRVHEKSRLLKFLK